MLNRYLNERDAAAFLGTSPATIRRLMHAGRLPRRYIGHSPKFLTEELEAAFRDRPYLPGEEEGHE